MSTLDERFMDRVLELAAQAYGQTAPNPMVGAIVARGSDILGEAMHRRAGLVHAEPQALAASGLSGAIASAFEADASGDGLTLYVNLEPCSHHGRTPPCVDAIRTSPVRRVVAALVDPNPEVAGRGVAALRASGIEVVTGCRHAEAAELNHLFIGRQLRQRAFVSLKVALSADDCIAAADGAPAAISGPDARAHSHHLRAGHDAILVGVETWQRDRPRLDRRLYDGPGSTPRRLILDPQLRSDARPTPGSGAKPILCCAQEAVEGASRAGHALALERWFELLPLPRRGADLDLEALLQRLEEHGIWSLLVEGGGRTHRGFLEAGLWDRMYVYRNPGLQLHGMPWGASNAWMTRGSRARELQRGCLGVDTLEVYAHRESMLPESVPAPQREAK